jgi:two-component system chemotaxis response regulator CheY
MANQKILIIDDEPDIQRLLKALLETAGYTVSAALDSMQALMIARQVKPDLMILDIRMPGGGGVKVYERLRMNTNFSNTPILVYTAVALKDVGPQIHEHPMTALLAKPAQPAEILSAVEQLLARAQQG